MHHFNYSDIDFISSIDSNSQEFLNYYRQAARNSSTSYLSTSSNESNIYLKKEVSNLSMQPKFAYPSYYSLNSYDSISNYQFASPANNKINISEKYFPTADLKKISPLVEIKKSTPNVSLSSSQKKLQFSKKYLNPMKSDPRINIGKFHLMRTIGKGSFGRVILSLHKENATFYAIKILKKEDVVKSKQISHVINERTILSACSHPNIAKLEFCFKDNSFLYLATAVACNGDLYTLLKAYKSFSENLSMFYAANICLALEYLHLNDIIYRDLKPENILIASNGYLKLTDFGFSKKVDSNLTQTMCGTPDYFSPEILERRKYGKSTDWWTFGVFIYELNKGKPPFHDENQLELYRKIKNCEFTIPDNFSTNLRNICSNLLVKDISKRLGCFAGGANDVKIHKWFETIDWNKIYSQTKTPPYVPKYKSPVSFAFEKTNTPEEKLIIATKDEYKNEFIDF